MSYTFPYKNVDSSFKLEFEKIIRTLYDNYFIDLVVIQIKSYWGLGFILIVIMYDCIITNTSVFQSAISSC